MGVSVTMTCGSQKVAPLAVPPAAVVRTPRPSRPWVHLSMHDKVISIGNAHRMQ